jgi:hypothetical protein
VGLGFIGSQLSRKNYFLKENDPFGMLSRTISTIVTATATDAITIR